MRALSYDRYGGRPEPVEVPDPSCPTDGVLVRVRATGVCRSDWHAWQGHDPVPLPMVPGHEFAGEVVQVGPGADGWTVGRRVTAPFVQGCGRCAWCAVGDAQVCPDQVQPGFTQHGTWAELVPVRAAPTNLVALPDAVDDVAAAALGCRLATAYRGLVVHGRLGPDQWLAVHGCGGVGLSAVLVGRSLGARVVGVDVSAAARGRAAALGATVLAPGQGAQLLDLTGGGAHVAVDAVGAPEVLDASVRSLRPRGRHVQVGLLLAEHATPPVPMDVVVARELSLHGSHGMAAAGYPGLLALVADGSLRPADLVGRVVGLDGAADALAAMGGPVTAGGTTVVRVG